MTETIIRTAADLEKAFAPLPAWHREMHRHYINIAEALNALTTPDWIDKELGGFKITAHVAPSERGADGWKYPRLFINGKQCYDVSMDEERHAGSWRRPTTGKIRLSIGGFGNRQSYPQRKDGSFSYEKIAQRLAADIYSAARKAACELAARAAASKNAEAIAALNERFGLKEYGEFGIKSSQQPGMLILTMGYKGDTKAGTPEQLAAVLEAFRAVGWIK